MSVGRERVLEEPSVEWKCRRESYDGGLVSAEAEGLVRLGDCLSFSGRFVW